MTSPEQSFHDAVDSVRERDPRFSREAYAFVVTSILDQIRRHPPERAADPVRRHLSGAEVVAGVADRARREFGPLAGTVLAEWHMTTSRHVGEIVFALIDAGQLGAQEEDRLEDFLEGPELPAPTVVSSGSGVRRDPGA